MKNLQMIAEAIGYYLTKRHDGYLLCRNRAGVGGVLCVWWTSTSSHTSCMHDLPRCALRISDVENDQQTDSASDRATGLVRARPGARRAPRWGSGAAAGGAPPASAPAGGASARATSRARTTPISWPTRGRASCQRRTG